MGACCCWKGGFCCWNGCCCCGKGGCGSRGSPPPLPGGCTAPGLVRPAPTRGSSCGEPPGTGAPGEAPPGGDHPPARARQRGQRAWLPAARTAYAHSQKSCPHTRGGIRAALCWPPGCPVAGKRGPLLRRRLPAPPRRRTRPAVPPLPRGLPLPAHLGAASALPSWSRFRSPPPGHRRPAERGCRVSGH